MPIPLEYIKYPCLNCTERNIGCHTRCDKYISASTKNNELKTARNIEQLKECVSVGVSTRHSPSHRRP